MPNARRGEKERPKAIYTSFECTAELNARLLLARAMTGRKQKDLVAEAITKHLDELGVPAAPPKLKEPRR